MLAENWKCILVFLTRTFFTSFEQLKCREENKRHKDLWNPTPGVSPVQKIQQNVEDFFNLSRVETIRWYLGLKQRWSQRESKMKFIRKSSKLTIKRMFSNIIKLCFQDHMMWQKSSYFIFNVCQSLLDVIHWKLFLHEILNLATSVCFYASLWHTFLLSDNHKSEDKGWVNQSCVVLII